MVNVGKYLGPMEHLGMYVLLKSLKQPKIIFPASHIYLFLIDNRKTYER